MSATYAEYLTLPLGIVQDARLLMEAEAQARMIAEAKSRG